MPLLAHLVAKDIRRKLRAPLGLIVVLAFPLLFAGMIALAFGKEQHPQGEDARRQRGRRPPGERRGFGVPRRSRRRSSSTPRP